MLFLGFSIESASWLPSAAVFPEGPPAPARSLAEDWRTLQVGCRAPGRQAGMRADAACKGEGEGRFLLGEGGNGGGNGNAAHRCSLPVGRLQSVKKGRARERQRCLIPSLPVAVFPSPLQQF